MSSSLANKNKRPSAPRDSAGSSAASGAKRVAGARSATGRGGGAGGRPNRRVTRSQRGGDVPAQVLVNNPDEPIIIMLGTRRGGCDKSTTTAALGYTLAHRGYNVMAVDCDPQSDLSQFLLRRKLTVEFQGDYDRMTHRSFCQPRVRTLYEAMNLYSRNAEAGQNIEVEPFEVLPAAEQRHGRFMLIAGNNDTGSLEYLMTLYENQSVNTTLAMQMLSHAYHLIREAARRTGCSIVLIDTNPFAGTWNQNLFLISDYLIMPCGADHASKSAIGALSRMILDPLKGWWRKRDTLVKILDDLDDGQRQSNDLAVANGGTPIVIKKFLIKTPKFLGILIGNYIIRETNATPGFVQGLSKDMPARAFLAVMSAEANAAEASMQAFRAAGLGIAEEHFTALNLVPGLLGRIRKFHSLEGISQLTGVPVPFLEGKDMVMQMEDGAIIKIRDRVRYLKGSEYFHAAYDQMAWNILSLIHRDSGRVAEPASWLSRNLGRPPAPTDNFFVQVVQPAVVAVEDDPAPANVFELVDANEEEEEEEEEEEGEGEGEGQA